MSDERAVILSRTYAEIIKGAERLLQSGYTFINLPQEILGFDFSNELVEISNDLAVPLSGLRAWLTLNGNIQRANTKDLTKIIINIEYVLQDIVEYVSARPEYTHLELKEGDRYENLPELSAILYVLNEISSCREAISEIDGNLNYLDADLQLSDVNDLEATAPSQTDAVFLFEVREDKVFVLRRDNVPLAGHENVASQTKEYLCRRAEEVKQGIARSNLPHDLSRIFSQIYESLNSGAEMVKLGLEIDQAKLTLQKHIDANPEELSASITAMLESYLKSLSGFVAQYEEWHKFLLAINDAALADPDNLVAVKEIVADLVRTRGQNAAWLDESAQNAIDWLQEALVNLGRSIKGRAGIILTVQNLYSAITQLTVGLAKAVGEEVKKQVLKIVVENAIHNVAPALKAARDFLDPSWISKLLDIAIPYLEKLNDKPKA